MAKYEFASSRAGKQCNFVAEEESREEAVRKAKEHIQACSACAGLSEEQISAAIQEKQ